MLPFLLPLLMAGGAGLGALFNHKHPLKGALMGGLLGGLGGAGLGALGIGGGAASGAAATSGAISAANAAAPLSLTSGVAPALPSQIANSVASPGILSKLHGLGALNKGLKLWSALPHGGGEQPQSQGMNDWGPATSQPSAPTPIASLGNSQPPGPIDPYGPYGVPQPFPRSKWGYG